MEEFQLAGWPEKLAVLVTLVPLQVTVGGVIAVPAATVVMSVMGLLPHAHESTLSFTVIDAQLSVVPPVQRPFSVTVAVGEKEPCAKLLQAGAPFQSKVVTGFPLHKIVGAVIDWPTVYVPDIVDPHVGVCGVIGTAGVQLTVLLLPPQVAVAVTVSGVTVVAEVFPNVAVTGVLPHFTVNVPVSTVFPAVSDAGPPVQTSSGMVELLDGVEELLDGVEELLLCTVQ